MKKKRLVDAYRFPGMRPLEQVRGVFGDPKARVITLVRRSKKRRAASVAACTGSCTTGRRRGPRSVVRGDAIYLEIEVRRVDCRRCGKVKRERLEFLADNPFYTKRFAFYVGRRCRIETIKDVAEELHLDWHTVKELDKQYMREQLAKAGTPAPKRIGIDEISIKKRHTYRIVVSDLVRQRPIWFGGEDRSEASMAQFYTWLGPKKSRADSPGGDGHVEAVPQLHAGPRAAGRHPVRQVPCPAPSRRGAGPGAQERVRPAVGKDRRFIKGQKYTLLSHRENLTLEGRQALKLLLAANKRLNTAYLLKESFGQLWDYQQRGLGRASSTTGAPRSSGSASSPTRSSPR